MIHKEATRKVTCQLSSSVNQKLSRRLSGQNGSFPSLPSFLFHLLFFFIPGTNTRSYIHTYIHTYVRANVPRVAFAMQNSSARRSLIMHSVRQRCATIESPRHALQRARSSARVDFPRYIYFHDGWSFASSYSRTRFCSEEFVEQWLFTGLFLRDGLKETLNCRIVVLLLAIF